MEKENDVIIDQIKDKFNSLHTIIATRESQLVNFVQAKTKADGAYLLLLLLFIIIIIIIDYYFFIIICL